jgi:response regulator RpfG family c-di-GMP phosphodiesterase
VFRPSWQFGEARGYPAWELSLIMLGVCVLALLLDAAMASLVRSARTRAPFIRTLGDELTAGLGLNSAVAATAVMISMTSSAMSFWALPVFALQMVLVQVAFKRYAMIRATYRQTIRALSRVTEVGGYTETGHARRVCDISLAVGREMGMAENDLLNLEYAALMHDIGQLSLDDPIPGGATVVAAPYQQRQIADKGADVIVETGVLDEVARIVRHIPDPYRRPQEVADKSIPLASRIIRAVNAFDDLVGGSLEGSRRFEALERLRLGMVYDFDPKVVETLSRIVERNTSFAM